MTNLDGIATDYAYSPPLGDFQVVHGQISPLVAKLQPELP
jgi:hypothetical protein